MKLSGKDLLIVGVMMGIGVFLYVGTLKKLGNDVPADKIHRDFYQQLRQGGQRTTIEAQCVTCHKIKSLPVAHPHKEECMVCHQPT